MAWPYHIDSVDQLHQGALSDIVLYLTVMSLGVQSHYSLSLCMKGGQGSQHVAVLSWFWATISCVFSFLHSAVDWVVGSVQQGTCTAHHLTLAAYYWFSLDIELL